jgi:hypothetical protein
MKQTTWAVLAALGISFAAPAIADDPPAAGSAEQLIQDQEAEAAAGQRTSTAQVVEVRDGAGSQEPADTESAEDRVERDFVTNVWNSP